MTEIYYLEDDENIAMAVAGKDIRFLYLDPWKAEGKHLNIIFRALH